MLDRFLVVLFQVITLFTMMGVGFAMGKLKFITQKGTSEMSSILINVACPALILNTFQMDWDKPFLITLGSGCLCMLGCYILFMIITRFFFRKQEEDSRVCLQFGSMYGNVGFMGIPLITAVLGSSNVVFAVLGVAVFDLAIFSHGAMLMGGRKAVSLKSLATNVVLISIVVGVILMLLRIKLPSPVYNAFTFLGNLNTPLSMLVIGAQLSRADLTKIFNRPIFYAVSAVKMIMVPVITALVLLPLHLDKNFYIAIVILFAAPVGGFTSIFAERYNRNVEYAAQLVSLSTLLSVITLPFAAVMAEYLCTLY